MEFLCYHRCRPGAFELRQQLLEDHWSYMDRYAETMIARGPTFADDGATLLGGVHVLDLRDPAAARAFAFEEPNYQAGVYRDVLLRRWQNLLGRTMWEFPGGRSGDDHYLVLGFGAGEPADLSVGAGGEDLIAFGPLWSDSGAAWLGTAAITRAGDAGAAAGVLTTARYASIEVYRWQFGGRPEAREP